MFVKICGITNRDDALAAVEAGASALGFIFCNRSPRHVSPRELAAWIEEIPPEIWRVGVFVDEVPEIIEQIGRNLRLDIAQLHGSETPGLHPRTLRVWKAFRVTGDQISDPAYPAEAILLDGPRSGYPFDWKAFQNGARSRMERNLVLAGGLTPENIREAIDLLHPWAVDTSSGVESSARHKDHQRMKMFIKAALRS
jgi:phosphoribosylanthranilate isomerase